MSARSACFALAAGLLIGLSGPPLSLSFLAFLAPAALLAAIEPGDPVRTRTALALGAITGFSTSAYSMYWVVGLLTAFARFPFALALPVASLLWLAQALPFALAAMLTATMMRRGAPGWIVLPAAMTMATSIVPALFPWRYGVSQMAFLPYAQSAELGGVALIDWLMGMVSCGALEALRRPKTLPAVVAALALAIPIGYGALRISQVRAERELAPQLLVGVIQPNVGISEKHDLRLHVPHLTRLHEMTREIEARGAELVLWPESAYPFPFHREEARDHGAPIGVVCEGVRGPVLTGTITTDGPSHRALVRDEVGRFRGAFRLGSGRRFNSAVLVGADGSLGGVADKVELLAFGEYVPFWDWIPPLQRFPRGLTPGSGAQVVGVGGARIGVLNCYEDLLADHVRSQARSGQPTFWANLTNNAWFGNTSAPHLHHLLARARAIETRRDLVRAVNTGVSGHTLATGEDAILTRPFTRASFVADVRLLSGSTPWIVLGDWVTPCLAGALLGFLLAERRRRRTLGAR